MLPVAHSLKRNGTTTPARRRGVLLVGCAAVCWSSGGLIARLVTTSPWTTSFWRSVFASPSLTGGALILALLLANTLVDLVTPRRPQAAGP